jgi:hypothetical protein
VAVERAEPNTVFLNIPYDAKFERLYLAYIVGLIELGLKPRATLAIEGVMRELCNAFVRTSKHPTVPDMLMTYRELRRLVPEIVRRVGGESVFEARTFEDLCVVAAALRQKRDG